MSLDEITHLADFRDLIVGATGLQAAVSRATWSARPSRECLVGPSACFAHPRRGVALPSMSETITAHG